PNGLRSLARTDSAARRWVRRNTRRASCFPEPLLGTSDALAWLRMKAPTDEPRPLPYCAYPSASDIVEHGVQRLPAILPRVDFERARPYRSPRYVTVPAAHPRPEPLPPPAEGV